MVILELGRVPTVRGAGPRIRLGLSPDKPLIVRPQMGVINVGGASFMVGVVNIAGLHQLGLTELPGASRCHPQRALAAEPLADSEAGRSVAPPH